MGGFLWGRGMNADIFFSRLDSQRFISNPTIFYHPSQPLRTPDKGVDVVDVARQFLRASLKSLRCLIPSTFHSNPLLQKAGIRKC
ncbi:hypothetical protein AGABI2DRAFT_195027 [Agaricus bisporus var. bisporus H97]|uniref:hypothetical protein n=1 Tax=Agaricus bisporus var. bisporus (strain H97 / ATCC MYA-4626 / FGSC 10389) TaxID=936046 RepID=UPI00029F5113|nr:hypothetical protein AGABI2DRAFT_195027 [Agaricus bisporus var. bisporus H97]EKV43351.1 hypothetical protein AGABI2DRAFT_195027 [Agaricus bisporus var. bisporus H97]